MRRKSFLLRLSQELYDDVQAWAAQELRSVNAQIEYLLRNAVLKRKGATAGEPPDPPPEGRRPPAR